MAFEELPPEYAEFFTNGGELPATLAAEHEAQLAEAPAPTPAPAATPAPTPAPVVDEAPVAPTANPYLERLLAEKDNQLKLVSNQIEELKLKIAKAQEPAAPDPAVDPLGSLQHQLKSLQTKLDNVLNAQTESQTMSVQEKNAQQFFNHVNSQIAEFKTTHTDYDAAYKHLIEVRKQDFRDQGMTADEAARSMGQEEMQIVQRAVTIGKNPAEIAYSMAKRYGYKPTAAVVTENKLETIKKGLEASQTTERGTPPSTGKVSLDNIESASDSDLNKAVENDWEGLFGKRKGIFG